MPIAGVRVDVMDKRSCWRSKTISKLSVDVKSNVRVRSNTFSGGVREGTRYRKSNKIFTCVRSGTYLGYGGKRTTYSFCLVRVSCVPPSYFNLSS